MTPDPKAVDGAKEVVRFAKLDFNSFRAMATDATLSDHEKVGFPDGLRAGFDAAIFADIRAKLPMLAEAGKAILDIGPGCGPLARMMIETAEAGQHRLVMVDHEEMLGQLPQGGFAGVTGRFPENIEAVRAAAPGGYDAILIYSVLQVVIFDMNPSVFIDAALSLLKPGGRLLIGDIANFSKLRRFLASVAGVQHHKAYMRTEEAPVVPPFALVPDRIDDGMLLGILMRARAAGFDAYLVPQPKGLPLANRREDLIFDRP